MSWKYMIGKKIRALLRFLKRNGRRIYFGTFIVGLGVLIVFNLKDIMTPPASSSYQEFFQSIILSETNKRLLILGVIYILAATLFFLIRLPFLRIEQLKVPGLEYKIMEEKKESVAMERFEKARQDETIRLGLLEIFNKRSMQEKFSETIVGLSFDMNLALNIFAEEIEAYYQYNKIDVKTGYVNVMDNSIVDPQSFNRLAFNIQEVVYQSIKERSGSYHSVREKTIVAIPLFWREEDIDFSVFFLEVPKECMVLYQTDCTLLNLCWKSINAYIFLRWYQNALDQSAG